MVTGRGSVGPGEGSEGETVSNTCVNRQQPTAEEVLERLGEACTRDAARELVRWYALPVVRQTRASGNRVGEWPKQDSMGIPAIALNGLEGGAVKTAISD